MLKVIFPVPPPTAAGRKPTAGDVVTVTYGKGEANERHYTGVVMLDLNRVFVLAARGKNPHYHPYETMEVGTAACIEFHDKATLVIGGGVE